MKISLIAALILFGIAFAVQIKSKDGDQMRVHGGHHAARGQFPWNAAVMDSTNFLCSANMITEYHLLTTANCVKGYAKSGTTGISVILGSLQPNSGSYEYPIHLISMHPDYTAKSLSNKEIYHSHNIAVLKSNVRIVLNLWVAPINLQNNIEAVADGTYVQLCGWGGQSTSLSTNLEFAYMSTKNVYTCIQEIGGTPSVEYYYNLCTPGFQQESGASSGACYYDHGGGLIVDYNTSPILVGLVSYASCDSTFIRSTIYTSIVAHRDWIANTIK